MNNFNERIKKCFGITEDDYNNQEVTASDVTETDYDDLEVSDKNFTVMNPIEVRTSRKLQELLKDPLISKWMSDPKKIILAVNYGRDANDGSIARYFADHADELVAPLTSKWDAKLKEDALKIFKYYSTCRDEDIVGNNRGLLIIDLNAPSEKLIINTSIVGSNPLAKNKWVYSYHSNGTTTTSKLAKYMVPGKNGWKLFKSYADARLDVDPIR